jgi:ribosomal protein S18 acetylase RimI-like enzyme
MQVSIRRAVPDDLDALTDLYLESARYHAEETDPLVFRVPERAVARTSIERTMGVHGAAILVAISPDRARCVGYAILVIEPNQMGGGTYREARYAFVDDLAVTEGARGHGVGTAILRAAEAWARERGARAMILDTHPNNGRALRFYKERMGYQDVQVRLIRRFD